MADVNFSVKNGILVGNTVTINTTAFYWNGTQFANQTNFSGTSNNATNLGGKTEGNLNVNNAVTLNGTSASGYQTTAGLAANVATLTANNSTFLGGAAANSFLSTGGSYTLSGNWNFSGAVTFSGSYNTGTGNQTTQTLSDSSGTINWNCANGPVAFVTLTGTGRTFAAPTNPKVGTYLVYITQDGAGGRTITSWNSIFKWPGAVPPPLTATAGATDLISLTYTGTVWMGSFLPDLR